MSNQMVSLQTFLRTKKAISPEECMELIKKYKVSKDETEKDEYREKIFSSISLFIMREARKFNRKNPYIEIEDFFNAGVIGFLRALEMFKAEDRVIFLGYAKFWIINRMHLVVANNYTLYVPPTYFFKNDFGKFEYKNYKFIHLDKKMEFIDGSGNDYNDIIPDKRIANIENRLTEEELTQNVIKILDRYLDIEEYNLIKAYHYDNLSYKEIVELYHFKSQPQVMEKIKKIYRKLRGIILKMYDNQVPLIN